MADIPEKLKETLEDFEFLDRNERINALIEMADRFQEVPPSVATRPFEEEHRVPRCESQAFVWAEDLPDGRLKFHFAVENPQGLSAKSMAVLLDETLSGEPLDQVVAVPGEIVFTLFGRDISMGKGEGLTGMLSMVKAYARERQKALAAGA
jgi:cysteine desulfuration protein SufE